MATRPRAVRAISPAALTKRLTAIARNYWWTWNPDAQDLFAALDPALWEALRRNPFATLATIPHYRLKAVAEDSAYLQSLGDVEAHLERYLSARTWFQRTAKGKQRNMQVAYFCAEFSLHESYPQYSGGLGVLAGDHLKSASDLGIPLCAVGLLYRSGYYEQELAIDGSTRALYPEHNFDLFPCTDTKKKIRIPLGKRTISARIWQTQIGRVMLYQLDTDLEENRPEDRTITRHLYGGDNETRIQQEIVLGIGGVLALEKLGIKPTVYHLNEGHAAFANLERLRTMVPKLGREKAMDRVRASTVFTTHTPVPAGHDRFDRKLFGKYLGGWERKLDLTQAELLELGSENAGDKHAPFCMTVLALNTADHCNGVAAIHGRVSREMWASIYDVANPKDTPIGHVTNGVHTQTWLAPELYDLYNRYLKPQWIGADPTNAWWSRVDRIPAEALWRVRNLLRQKLVQFIRERLRDQIRRKLGGASDLMQAYDAFDDQALTIGFARRFATYKRAPLIFHNPKRLASILNDAKLPVQLVFAGKAHPKDVPGQAFAQKIYQFSRKAGFSHRVVLLENYDMQIGRMMTGGCDVWLNNPLRPMEASGTSGMKPPLHGGINCSILDGWWPEAYNRRNGWAIGDGRELKSQRQQDAYDADALYDLLENEVVPEFYSRGRDGVPKRWAKRMAESMKTVANDFSTHRMLGDYTRDYYLAAHSA